MRLFFSTFHRWLDDQVEAHETPAAREGTEAFSKCFFMEHSGVLLVRYQEKYNEECLEEITCFSHCTLLSNPNSQMLNDLHFRLIKMSL